MAGRSGGTGGGADGGGAAPRDTATLRALAHPIRLRILSLLTGAAMSAAELARELELTHANASYHLRQLRAAGEVEEAGDEHIRGGVAKRYRYRPGYAEDAPPAGIWSDQTAGPPTSERSDPADRRALYLAVASGLRRRAGRLRPELGRQHLTDADLWVDPDTWAEVLALVTTASKTLHRAARPPRTPGTVRVNATLVLFELAAQG